MDVLRSYCENFTINEGYIVFGRRIYWPQSSQHNKALANDFFLMRKNCFPLVRWTTYTNQAMYTLNIYRYSTIYRYLSYIWLSLCDTLDQKRWGNRYPHNSKRLPDKTCYFSTSIRTHLLASKCTDKAFANNIMFPSKHLMMWLFETKCRSWHI